MMPYGDEFSRYPSMKGISLDLPFIKFRYVKVENNEPEETVPLKLTDRSDSSENSTSLDTRRIIYTKEAQVTTFGLDPMVSHASVIHELVYGRTDLSSSSNQTNFNSSYPTLEEPSQHSLDLIV